MTNKFSDKSTSHNISYKSNFITTYRSKSAIIQGSKIYSINIVNTCQGQELRDCVVHYNALLGFLSLDSITKQLINVNVILAIKDLSDEAVMQYFPLLLNLTLLIPAE
jgi:hypothetical protein